MDLNALDFIVKFLAAATFAVAILAILWAAWQARSASDQPTQTSATAYARFTSMCIGIAVIAGVAALSNAFLNYAQVAIARNNAQSAQESAADLEIQFADALTQIDSLTAATRRAAEADKQRTGASDLSRNRELELNAAYVRLEKATQALKAIDSEIDFVADAVNRLNTSADTLPLRAQLADIKKSVRDGLQ